MKTFLAVALFVCACALAHAHNLDHQLNWCQEQLAGAETAKAAAQNRLDTLLAPVAQKSAELKAAHKAGRMLNQQLDKCLK